MSSEVAWTREDGRIPAGICISISMLFPGSLRGSGCRGGILIENLFELLALSVGLVQALFNTRASSSSSSSSSSCFCLNRFIQAKTGGGRTPPLFSFSPSLDSPGHVPTRPLFLPLF